MSELITSCISENMESLKYKSDNDVKIMTVNHLKNEIMRTISRVMKVLRKSERQNEDKNEYYSRKDKITKSKINTPFFPNNNILI